MGWLSDSESSSSDIALASLAKPKAKQGSSEKKAYGKKGNSGGSGGKKTKDEKDEFAALFGMDDEMPDEFKLSSEAAALAMGADDSSSGGDIVTVPDDNDNDDESDTEPAVKKSKTTNGSVKKKEVKQEGKAVGKKEEGTEKMERGVGRSKARLATELPLSLPANVNRTTMLVQSEEASLNLTGDVGAVGRARITDDEIELDLKGTVYRADIVPTNTFAVINVGASEARIEAIMSDALVLTVVSTPQDTETLYEGNVGSMNAGTSAKVATKKRATKAKSKGKGKRKRK